MVWKLIGGAIIVTVIVLAVCTFAVASEMAHYRMKDRRP